MGISFAAQVRDLWYESGRNLLFGRVTAINNVLLYCAPFRNDTPFRLGENSIVFAWIAQSVERTTLNRVVVGSIPTLGVILHVCMRFSSLSNPLFLHADSDKDNPSFNYPFAIGMVMYLMNNTPLLLSFLIQKLFITSFDTFKELFIRLSSSSRRHLTLLLSALVLWKLKHTEEHYLSVIESEYTALSMTMSQRYNGMVMPMLGATTKASIVIKSKT
eukprot:scaffold10917_cov155-Amphora_coffeaeformis.AAC.1